MFYQMTQSDFRRVSVVVEVIKMGSHWLPKDDANKLWDMAINGNEENFDQFCLAVADEWCDSYPQVTTNDYESIAKIISNCLMEV